MYWGFNICKYTQITSLVNKRYLQVIHKSLHWWIRDIWKWYTHITCFSWAEVRKLATHVWCHSSQFCSIIDQISLVELAYWWRVMPMKCWDGFKRGSSEVSEGERFLKSISPSENSLLGFDPWSTSQTSNTQKTICAVPDGAWGGKCEVLEAQLASTRSQHPLVVGLGTEAVHQGDGPPTVPSWTAIGRSES